MSVLLSLALRLLLWVGVLCLVAGLVVVGPRRLANLRHQALPRIREVRLPILALVGVLVVSAVGRGALQTISEVIALRPGPLVYAVEGDFVEWFQTTFVTPELTIYFSWIYVYGYVFLLVFPFIAYGALEESTTLKRLITAYSLNYAIGLLFYTLILMHGPRNYVVGESLLYTFNPDFQALTTEVNETTNVFPSLHTSLSVTVAAFAYLTRDEYPVWAWVAGWLAVSVMVATMYLGIHWLVDVIGGVGLALGSVVLSYRFVSPAIGEVEEETATVLDEPESEA